MASLGLRAPLVAILVALAILTAYLPPQPRQHRDYYGMSWQDFPTPEARTAARLGAEYRAAVDRVKIRDLRDSVMRVLSRRPSRGGQVWGMSTRMVFDSALRILLRAATPPTALASDVQTVFGVTPGNPFYVQRVTLLPTATDGHACVILETADTARRPVFRMAHPRDALGPCAFFAAFGLPGKGVAQWLEYRGYDVAWLPDWTVRPHAPYPMERSTATEWFETTLSHLGGVTTPGDYLGYAGLYWESGSLLSCATGKVEGCHRYFFTLRGDLVRHPMPGAYEGIPSFNDATGRVLATLVREQGPERFAKFWRSPLPPQQAFDAAFTVPFDQWAPAWAKSNFPPFNVGVSTETRELGSSLLWIGLGLAACAGFALSRRVV